MLVIFSKRERRILQFVLGIEGDGRFLVGGQAGVNYQIGHQQQRQQHAVGYAVGAGVAIEA
jgi:hypothetical protein